MLVGSRPLKKQSPRSRGGPKEQGSRRVPPPCIVGCVADGEGLVPRPEGPVHRSVLLQVHGAGPRRLRRGLLRRLEQEARVTGGALADAGGTQKGRRGGTGLFEPAEFSADGHS